MTAPLYRLPGGAIAALAPGDRVVLDGPGGHHAATVKRARLGQPVLFADDGHQIVRATVVQVGPGTLVARVAAVCDAARPGPRLVLVQALAKQDRDLQAIEMATELGVDEVVPWQAERSIVRWRGERGDRARRKWVTVTESAAQQSRRPDTPHVAEAVTLTGLCAAVAAATVTLVLHETAAAPLRGADLPASGQVLLVVGPEGGITDGELTALAEAGAVMVRLGPYVLRPSSAGPAAPAVLAAACRWR